MEYTELQEKPAMRKVASLINDALGSVFLVAQADANKRADVRALLKRDIATLNTLLAKLHPDLPVQDRSPVEFAIPRIKFALMKAYWPENEAGWGDPERFEAWLDAGEPQPSPPEIAAAIAYFYTAAPRVKP